MTRTQSRKETQGTPLSRALREEDQNRGGRHFDGKHKQTSIKPLKKGAKAFLAEEKLLQDWRGRKTRKRAGIVVVPWASREKRGKVVSEKKKSIEMPLLRDPIGPP